MSRSRCLALRVLHLRVKDKHAAWLSGLAREVNTVFNYCNELSGKVFDRERRFLTGFDFCSTSALTQACGSMKSRKRFPPRPVARVTAALAREARKVLE